MMTHLSVLGLAELAGRRIPFMANLNRYACTGGQIAAPMTHIIGVNKIASAGGELPALPTCPRCAVLLDEALATAPTRP